MINKKIILGLFLASFLGACASPTAMIAPAYSLTSSGNVLQAGLSYGTNQLITVSTGKTPVENLKEIKPVEKNIKKIIKFLGVLHQENIFFWESMELSISNMQ